LIFRLLACRFHFRALESVFFPPGKAGNVLRGALGSSLSNLSAPRAGRPSGLAEPPRPFVFRAAHLNGKCIAVGETFHLDLHVFDLHAAWVETFVQVFSTWATTGLGPRRGRVELLGTPSAAPVAVDLSPAGSASRCSVAFRTPTELKGCNSKDDMPFAILFARIRDRISTLRALYGEGPFPIDFQAMAARAATVRTLRCDLEYRDVIRRSSRTGDVHSIGGVEGSADYEGDLTEFVPWLKAAWYTGVGRHTVWGNGVIEVMRFE
jgi:CRISPR-associated endoribonuclease Cas6